MEMGFPSTPAGHRTNPMAAQTRAYYDDDHLSLTGEGERERSDGDDVAGALLLYDEVLLIVVMLLLCQGFG
eukprot:scaffold69110_cov26-Cyclotella_meneghiniana.AAC.2